MSRKVHEVFGIRPEISDASYIDRGSLDSEFSKLLERKQTHIAIRGASKTGKSWLRQKILKNPITVQCRLKFTSIDIYINALAQLGITLTVEKTAANNIKGKLVAKGEVGIKLFAKAGADLEGAIESGATEKSVVIGQDSNDIHFIASILRESGRTLVIEDFHYLPIEEQKNFAFDLKTLWDYKTFVVVIGVWISENMLITLNPDLSDRIEEFPVTWQPGDLKKVLKKGGDVLRLEFSDRVANELAEYAYGSPGLLQKLTLRAVDDELGITVRNDSDVVIVIDDIEKVRDAAMHIAEQLNQLYQAFAKRVCEGIRTRKNSTGIYAHAMAAIMSASDQALTQGLSAKEIHAVAKAREPRIQYGNLKAVLSRFEELQVDSDGRGLVLGYDPQDEIITVVDRQLLLYRRFATVQWPWEELISEVSAQANAFGDSSIVTC